jgi:hypothetical protein
MKIFAIIAALAVFLFCHRADAAPPCDSTCNCSKVGCNCGGNMEQKCECKSCPCPTQFIAFGPFGILGNRGSSGNSACANGSCAAPQAVAVQEPIPAPLPTFKLPYKLYTGSMDAPKQVGKVEGYTSLEAAKADAKTMSGEMGPIMIHDANGVMVSDGRPRASVTVQTPDVSVSVEAGRQRRFHIPHPFHRR